LGIFDNIRDKMLGGGAEKPVIQDPFDQTQDEQKLAGWVKSKVEDARGQGNRTALESLWMRNSAAVMGFTGVYWDAASKAYKPTDGQVSSLKRNRLYSNLILPACQNRLARLCKNPPRYEVLPNSTEEEDKDAAELGVDLINHVWDEQRINEKRMAALMYTQQCGHSWLYACFDPDLGEFLVDPETGERVGKEGKIRIDVVSPFEVFVDPLAKNTDEMTWLARCKVRKLEYFKTRYPEKGAAVKEEGAWLQSTQYDMRLNTLNNSAMGPGGGPIADVMKNCAIEISYYEAPSQDHPNGRLVIIANGVVLKDEELPVGIFPFVRLDDIVVGGKFYPEATVTHAVPLQEQYNRNVQKMAQWTNTLLAGKYIAAKGHGLIQEALNNQSGEVVEYNPVPNAAPPSAMSIPVMPSYIFNHQESIEKDLFQIFGLSEISRGNIPSAGFPAVGMQLIVDQDETRIGIEVEQHEHAYAQLGRLILLYVDKYYVVERKLKIRRGGKYSVKNYSGKDLSGNFDVTVRRGSTIPNNTFLKRQEIMNLFGQGMYGDPMDPLVKEEVANDLEFGDRPQVFNDIRLQRAFVKRHMDMIIDDGVEPGVDEMDPHSMFIKQINNYRMTEDFDALPLDRQQMLLNLREAHVNAASQMTAPQLPPDDSDLDLHETMENTNLDALHESDAMKNTEEAVAQDENVTQNEGGSV
jgi:hypothetical protein